MNAQERLVKYQDIRAKFSHDASQKVSTTEQVSLNSSRPQKADICKQQL
jgi:hypothetical protein